MAGRNNTGYTLIELLLYVAITSVLLASVVSFFGVVTSSRIKNQTISEVNDQGQFAMDYMTLIIRGATAISSPAVATNDSQATVTVPTSSLSPTTFSVASGVLQVKEGAAAAVALTNSKVQVNSFTVKNLTRSGTDGALQLSFTLSRVSGSGFAEYDYRRTFTTTVALR